MTPSVDVVIPVHGQWELTERCLATLARRDPCVRRVIVVDDASPDDTRARLAERRDVEALILPRNLGFAGACNAGARRCDADAIFFLNNDTLVEPGTIERLAQTLADPALAAVGPKLLHGDGTMQAAGLTMIASRPNFERLFVYLDADLPEGQLPYEPLALCGAALLVRREAFFAVGGFDEGYRNGYEDVDLSMTLWAHGYRLRYEPSAAIVHLEGASRGKVIDDGANERRFASRWAARSHAVPRWNEPLPPALDLRWRSATPLEETVRTAWRNALAAHAGARVVENHPTFARLAAALDRRAVLTVEHRAPAAPARVTWCAPSDPGEAAALAKRESASYWAGSERAAAALREAGAARERIHITRVGFPVGDSDPRREPRAIVVRNEATAHERAERAAAALEPLPVEILVAQRADPAALARVRRATHVVVVDDGDPWGLLGGAALAAGALVVAPPEAVFLEVVPPAFYVAAPADALADAAREIVADPQRFASLGASAAREMARRAPDVYAGRRIRELGRALVHGAVDPRSLSMTDATAATLGITVPAAEGTRR